MATARKILIADPDITAARALTRSLRPRGYAVYYAPDGSKALELAVRAAITSQKKNPLGASSSACSRRRRAPMS